MSHMYDPRQLRIHPLDRKSGAFFGILRKAALAGTMMLFIKHREELNAHRQKTRDAAEGGDPSAMMRLYWIGKTQTGEKDMARAVELLEAHESALAKSYLYQSILKTVPWDSREGLLLQARAWKENYRLPGLDDAVATSMIQQHDLYLSNLRKAAADGDEDARWVVEELAADGEETPLSE